MAESNDRGRGRQESGKRKSIEREAFRLFMQHGYKKTSYTDIAQASDCTRALVQYYFPKKDALLKDFVRRLLDLCDRHHAMSGLQTGSLFQDFYMTGQMYFHFLLKNEELAALAFDFVSDRAATGASIASMAEWVSQYEKLDHVGQRAVLDGVLMAMGGAYELAYHYLTVGEEVDIPVLLRRVISAFLLEAEIGDSAGSSSFASCVLDDRALKASDDFILAHILDE